MPDLSHLRIGDPVLIARGQRQYDVLIPGSVVHVGTKLLTVADARGQLVEKKFYRVSGANNGQYGWPKITTAEAVEDARQRTELSDQLRQKGLMPTMALGESMPLDRLRRILAILEEE